MDLERLKISKTSKTKKTRDKVSMNNTNYQLPIIISPFGEQVKLVNATYIVVKCSVLKLFDWVAYFIFKCCPLPLPSRKNNKQT